MKKPEFNISELFRSESLSTDEMSSVLGGSRPRPKSRDKDIYDLDEDDD